jgi:activator of HSP90 ATPase
METKTITHEVMFSATPREVFEALIDSDKHAAFSGAPAKIERKAGGKFTCYGNHLEGTTLGLKDDESIVQDWRAKNWPKGHYSRVSFSLTPLAEGRSSLLSFVQIGVPNDHFDDINRGCFRQSKVAVVRRFIEEFKNKANLDIVDELFTSDFVLHLPGMQLPPDHRVRRMWAG